MLWRGRRQSVNIEDLRTNPKVIGVFWYSLNPNGTFIVDTDGLVYAGGDEFAASLITVGDQEDISLSFIEGDQGYVDKDKWTPNLTSGQKYALKVIVKRALQLIDKKKLTIAGNADDTYLREYLADLVNNN